jgi:hypothetical protein
VLKEASTVGIEHKVRPFALVVVQHVRYVLSSKECCLEPIHATNHLPAIRTDFDYLKTKSTLDNSQKG